jgi:hypothetical protein
MRSKKITINRFVYYLSRAVDRDKYGSASLYLLYIQYFISVDNEGWSWKILNPFSVETAYTMIEYDG